MSTPISRCSGCGLEVGHLPRCPYDEAVGVSAGDGTPGPAPEAAPIDRESNAKQAKRASELVVMLDRKRSRGTAILTNLDARNIQEALEDAIWAHDALASGDSGGPREAAPDDLASARWEILALTRQLDQWAKRYAALRAEGPREADSDESLDLRDDWEKLVEENAALRAELGRAPNGWEAP